MPAKKKTAKIPVKRPPSIRQLRFEELIAAGEVPATAWIEAGHKVTRNVAKSAANRSLSYVDVKARIAILRAPQTAATQLTRDAKRNMLREIAENRNASLDARIRAMAEDSKMAGHYEPEHHVVDAGPNTIASIRERAAKVRSAMSSIGMFDL